MIQNLVRAREERGRNQGIRMAFARPRLGTAIVMGEAARLTRAIENLIDNAVSFSPPGGLVEVVATRVDDKVLIRIEDEGPGVPPDVREEIFNRFHSLRPDNEAFGKHSGLGLAIARTIIEGHGGRIKVQDREAGAQGACFLIRLPWQAPPE
jgi:two-component system sensor histidine kinase ChvG